MKNILSLIVTACTFSTSYAQDNIYLLYNQLPITINPSLSGSASGMRLNAVYQSSTLNDDNFKGYHSTGLSFDLPIVIKNDNKIGIGYKTSYDVAGSTEFKHYGNFLSVAYHKSLNKNKDKPHYLAIGFEGGFVSNSLSGKDLRWPSQIGPNGFDPNLPSGENVDLSLRHFDLNIGASWIAYLHKNVKSTIGIAINHINTPAVSFLGTTVYEIKKRFVTHLSLDVALSEKWSFATSVLYIEQGYLSYYIMNAAVHYKTGNNSTLGLGGGYAKNGQPFINANFILRNFNIGLAYGFDNDAGLNKMEVGLGYIINGNTSK